MSMLGARSLDEMLRAEAAPFFAQVEESQQGNPSTLTDGGRGEHNILRHEERHLFLQIPVSPRKVPSLPVSCPFNIFNFRSFLKVRSLFRSQNLQKSVH